MVERPDWGLIFTNAYDNPKIKGYVHQKIFRGRKRFKVSEEELKEIIIQVCSILMEEVSKTD